MDLVSQIWVTVFGLTALGCMQTHRASVRRWGVVLGLIGQPAWYVQLVLHAQWGMLPVFVGYTGVWLFGAWNLWVRVWLVGWMGRARRDWGGLAPGGPGRRRRKGRR